MQPGLSRDVSFENDMSDVIMKSAMQSLSKELFNSWATCTEPPQPLYQPPVDDDKLHKEILERLNNGTYPGAKAAREISQSILDGKPTIPSNEDNLPAWFNLQQIMN